MTTVTGEFSLAIYFRCYGYISITKPVKVIGLWNCSALGFYFRRIQWEDIFKIKLYGLLFQLPQITGLLALHNQKHLL